MRRLRERGAEVRVAMTEAAKAFITPLSLQAVSGYPVSDSLLDPAAEAAMGHIELGKWADSVILAPATADLIARVAAGMANDLVSTICLATPSPVAVVPAMNQQMYRAQATQHNLQTLATRGLLLWGPDSGSQPAATSARENARSANYRRHGRAAFRLPVKDLQHLNLMITAGPTREPLIRCVISPTTALARWASRLPPPQRSGRERDLDQRAGIATDPAVCAAH
nr:DNA/pantothenate metabolism flavoprotein [Klebsiella pneumoniae]